MPAVVSSTEIQRAQRLSPPPTDIGNNCCYEELRYYALSAASELLDCLSAAACNNFVQIFNFPIEKMLLSLPACFKIFTAWSWTVGM